MRITADSPHKTPVLEPQIAQSESYLFIFAYEQIVMEEVDSTAFKLREVRPPIQFYEPNFREQPLKKEKTELLLEWIKKYTPDEEYASLLDKAEEETRRGLKLR